MIEHCLDQHVLNLDRLGRGEPFAAPRNVLGQNLDFREAFGRFEQHLADNALALREMTYQLGPRLTFDPKAEDFGSDTEANALLTREYREPFVVPQRL